MRVGGSRCYSRELLLPSYEGALTMSFGMYQASIPGFIKTLNNLTAILDKAERYVTEGKTPMCC